VISRRHKPDAGDSYIDPSATIEPTAIIGAPFRRLLSGQPYEFGRTTVRAKVSIGHYVVLGRGSTIGQDTIIDDFAKIECGVQLGLRCLIQSRAQICSEACLGDDCVVGGFVTERTMIGSRCRIFGSIVHAQRDATLPWDDDASMEPSAAIGDDVFIGFGAVIVGAITIGNGAYIAANATVTKDVLSGVKIIGVNQRM
jgi:UDP-3-O-[3-hydroxymyristoyl] glucosamine N-acyltransferase